MDTPTAHDRPGAAKRPAPSVVNGRASYDAGRPRGRRGRGSLRAPAQDAVAPGDALKCDDLDRVAIQPQSRNQPGVVVPLLLDALRGRTRHDLARDVPGGRLADADQRVVPAAEVGVDGCYGVDAVADEQVARPADGAVARGAAGDDTLHPERLPIDLGADDERAPHRDALAVGVHRPERLVEVEVHARLGPGPPNLHLEGRGQPAD